MDRRLRSAAASLLAYTSGSSGLSRASRSHSATCRAAALSPSAAAVLWPPLRGGLGAAAASSCSCRTTASANCASHPGRFLSYQGC